MELSPGEKIPENLLAEKFAISRTPVRAALAKLESLGFVKVLPQRGTFVTKLSIQKILEARFLREAIEVAVACDLAEDFKPAAIERCNEILVQQKGVAKKNDALMFQKLDDLFHETLANATGFPRVSEVVKAEKAHIDRVRKLSLTEYSGQYDQVIAQHSEILKAIQTRDAAKAKLAMQSHMRDLLTFLALVPDKHPEYFTQG
ncbi:MAG: GntR family transcriptional regulator [Cellvibrionaceae bacterium]|nr:GntR family transcriptional regulator [Cellvibrionaceae bacterium]